MKRFDVNKLPTKYIKMIDTIFWNEGYFDEEILGQCWLDDRYELEDGSHIFVFTSKTDLINTLRLEVNEVGNLHL